MPVATKHIAAGSQDDRPAIGSATAVEFDYGEAAAHDAPKDPLSIGNVPMPSATEGRKLKRQRLDTVPTMEGLETYIRSKVPDPDDPEFESKMTLALGKEYGVKNGEGKGQSKDTASVAGTTMGSLRRTVHQMLKMSAAAAEEKEAAATGGNATAAEVVRKKYNNNQQPLYPHAFCADTPQNLEIVTCEVVGATDAPEDWTIPPMTPVFYCETNTSKSVHSSVYGNYREFGLQGVFAGVSLHDGLQAHAHTKAHPSARCLAIAVGGVVNLSCDKFTAAQFQFGDYVYIKERPPSGTFFMGKNDFLTGMVDNKNQHVPRYYANPEHPDKRILATIPKVYERDMCLGRFVSHISKSHGGIRIVLGPSRWF